MLATQTSDTLPRSEFEYGMNHCVCLAGYVNDVPQARANAYGYRVLGAGLVRTLQARGMVHDRSKVALHILPPDSARFMLGRWNWLYTMHENSVLPDKYLDPLAQADLVLVPSSWVREIMCKHLPETKVVVVPPGIEPEYRYIERDVCRIGGRPFRFLFVGAPNVRKGIIELREAWMRSFWDKPWFELYFKVSGLSQPAPIAKRGNIVMDNRDLTTEELNSLYQESDCLVSPSRGEAFNLVLAEAMATGMPCVATGYGGPMDYLDETTGYPVDFETRPGPYKDMGRDLPGTYPIVYPVVDDLEKKMHEVYTRYYEALRRGRDASQRVISRFQWSKTSAQIAALLQNVP